VPPPDPVVGTPPPARASPPLASVMSTQYVFNGPLLWLGDRLAKNRERMGVHYPSDSGFSRWLAGALWALLTKSANPAQAKPPAGTLPVAADFIDCPTLQQVLRMTKAEWA
jgi:hypothetical protein